MEISKKYSIGLGLLVLAAGAQAQTNPFAKGPDPTLASIRAAGPFTLASQTLAKGNGFGGATIYTPTAAGTYAMVAVCPGFTEKQNAISTISQRLATHGFIVATIDTNSTTDSPESRAIQLQAALNTISTLTTGPIAGKVRAGSLAVSGHSMGGGASLIILKTNKTLVASQAISPYISSTTSKNLSTVVTPAGITVGSADNVAPDARHSQVFYNSIPATTPKEHAVIQGQGHQFVEKWPMELFIKNTGLCKVETTTYTATVWDTAPWRSAPTPTSGSPTSSAPIFTTATATRCSTLKWGSSAWC
jgi:dienelactone hydrolase